MLILKILLLGPAQGHGVALGIEQVSASVFRINPGSRLPAISRLERADQVNSERRPTQNNRRAEHYRLAAGRRKALTTETDQWNPPGGGDSPHSGSQNPLPGEPA